MALAPDDGVAVECGRPWAAPAGRAGAWCRPLSALADTHGAQPPDGERDQPGREHHRPGQEVQLRGEARTPRRRWLVGEEGEHEGMGPHQPARGKRPAGEVARHHDPDRQEQQPAEPDEVHRQQHLVGLPGPERERQGERAAEHGEAHEHGERPTEAAGSIPPNRLVIASTGRAAAIVASTGNSPAASLPSTTSALERSVARISSKVPRALSWQITPAVAAGAASRTVTTAAHSIIPKNIFARSACACMVEGPVRRDSTSQTSAPARPGARGQSPHARRTSSSAGLPAATHKQRRDRARGGVSSMHPWVAAGDSGRFSQAGQPATPARRSAGPFANSSRPQNEPFRNPARCPLASPQYGQNTVLKAVPKTPSRILDPGFAFRHHPAERNTWPMSIGYNLNTYLTFIARRDAHST